jgi:hypothetical protein
VHAQKRSGQRCIIDPIDMPVHADSGSVLTELFDEIVKSLSKSHLSSKIHDS